MRGVLASLHGPAKVDGGGARGGYPRGLSVQLTEKRRHGGGFDAARGNGHGVGRGDADGGRPPHTHAAYGLDGAGHVADGHPFFARGEHRLVEQEELSVLPDDGLKFLGDGG